MYLYLYLRYISKVSSPTLNFSIKFVNGLERTFLAATAAAQHVVALHTVEDLFLGNGETHWAHHAHIFHVVAAAADTRSGKVVGSRYISKGNKVLVFRMLSRAVSNPIPKNRNSSSNWQFFANFLELEPEL